jgi:cytochrome P450
MQFTPERFLEGGDSVGMDMMGTKGIRIMPFGVGRMICAGLSPCCTSSPWWPTW